MSTVKGTDALPQSGAAGDVAGHERGRPGGRSAGRRSGRGASLGAARALGCDHSPAFHIILFRLAGCKKLVILQETDTQNYLFFFFL